MDESKSELKLQLIQHIGTASSIAESVRVFKEYVRELDDCRFIFAAEQGGQPGYAVNKTFSSGAAIRTLFPSDRVLVIDRDSVARNGNYDYTIDYSIALDTQAVSYFKPFLEGGRVPDDVAEVVEFLAGDCVSFDPLPYVFENLSNLDEGLTATEKIFKKAIGYETIRTLDLQHLRDFGIVRSFLDADALAKQAAHVLATMHHNALNNRFIQEIKHIHQTMYLLLLEMAIIQIGRPQDSLKKKLGTFLHFCDKRLATMHLRELPIAKAYFERGQNLGFFSKIQKKYQGDRTLFEHIENMAWDLYHVRHLELAMGIHRQQKVNYFFSALLTFDKDLIEILDICSLRSIALVGEPPQPMPFPIQDPVTFLDSADVEAVFSADANRARNMRRLATNAERPLLVRELESQLAETASICPRLHPS